MILVKSSKYSILFLPINTFNLGNKKDSTVGNNSGLSFMDVKTTKIAFKHSNAASPVDSLSSEWQILSNACHCGGMCVKGGG